MVSLLWRTVTDEIGRANPDITLAHQLVDSCAMLLIRRPADFDVIVTENLFGDILSDEAAVLAGSLGMLPSASLGERQTAHGTFGLYEPIHGSAPDIAGEDKANPIGTILSAAMLMRLSLGREDVADEIEAAVSAALDDGRRTADLAETPDVTDDGLVVVGTTAFTTAVIEQLTAGAGGVTTVDDAPVVLYDTTLRDGTQGRTSRCRSPTRCAWPGCSTSTGCRSSRAAGRWSSATDSGGRSVVETGLVATPTIWRGGSSLERSTTLDRGSQFHYVSAYNGA